MQQCLFFPYLNVTKQKPSSFFLFFPNETAATTQKIMVITEERRGTSTAHNFTAAFEFFKERILKAQNKGVVYFLKRISWKAKDVIAYQTRHVEQTQICRGLLRELLNLDNCRHLSPDHGKEEETRAPCLIALEMPLNSAHSEVRRLELFCKVPFLSLRSAQPSSRSPILLVWTKYLTCEGQHTQQQQFNKAPRVCKAKSDIYWWSRELHDFISLHFHVIIDYAIH